MSNIDCRVTRRLFLGTILWLLTGSAVADSLAEPAAANHDNPVAFVRSLSESAIALFSDKTMTVTERNRMFRELLIERFDMPSIGRLVLGRYWRQTTEAQKVLFSKLFEDFVVTTYSHRLDAYSGEKLTIGKSRKAGENVTVVGSQVARDQQSPVDVDWMLRLNNGRWHVVDVVIEGISMVISQRSEFAAIINKQGGIDGLIQALRTRVNAVSINQAE